MAPHTSADKRITTTDYQSVLTIRDAFRGEKYAIRLRGQNIAWRVVARGFVGDEELATGTIALGALQVVRVSGLPETIGAARLHLEVKLSTASAPVPVQAEASWIPIAEVSNGRDCGCAHSGRGGRAVVEFFDDDGDYAPAPEGYYGPVWRARHPHGLPTGVSPCSADGAALPAIRSYARSKGHGAHFVQTCVVMAGKESGARYYRPANDFEYRCAPSTQSYASRGLCRLEDGLRPEGKKGGIKSAYGVFQPNRDNLWMTNPGLMPWEMTPRQQVEIPINNFAVVWAATGRISSRPVDQVRAVFLWQALPSRVDQFHRIGERSGWDTAWNSARVWLGNGRADKINGYVAKSLA